MASLYTGNKYRTSKDLTEQDLKREVNIDEKTHAKARHSGKGKRWICRRSFLLRLWCADETGGFNWQASLEIPENGERIGFASLEDLFTYLMDLATSND